LANGKKEAKNWKAEAFPIFNFSKPLSKFPIIKFKISEN
jgi:hypothetical protein